MAGLLRRLGFAPKDIQPAIILIGATPVTVIFRRNAQAKRLIIRLSKSGKDVVVTLPKRAGEKSALAFVEKSSAWIATQLARRRKPAEGSLSFRGVMHRIEATAERRGLIRVADGVIRVPGDAQHVERRLRDWLKREARADLTAASLRYAEAMNTTVKAISIRDQSSRWGSCSVDGKLSYSWRLILAPSVVLDYVAAHEVAHRLEMNHGPKFWRLVLAHCPHTKEAKRWLKFHGRELHQGFS
jgi:predicted metal-dependent hydrolase